jgi:serine/threonine protein kinase
LDGDNAKLCDFGLSRKEETQMTKRSMGTLGYTAPEVLKEFKYSKKSDVYAFGVVLLELATKQKAWDGLTEETIETAIKQGKMPTLMSRIDNQLNTCVASCLKLDPNQRPSFKELSALLSDTAITEKFLD